MKTINSTLKYEMFAITSSYIQNFCNDNEFSLVGGKIYPLVSRTHWNSPESGSVTLDPVCCCQTMGTEICKSNITGCFIIIQNVHSFQHIQNAEIKFKWIWNEVGWRYMCMLMHFSCSLADFVTATCVYYQTLL